ncbi:MAG: phosphoglycerate dehydrogenase [Deltaproteobacteria bacterium]|nr:phosphoglycerate dehydrogenase [Deltaproteobacteria bacterium]
MKVLISDKLSETGVKIFQDAPGIEVIFEPGLGKDSDKLKKVIADVDAIAIRSGTNIDADILAAAKNLKVIGRAGIGVDNVDIPEASKRGIIVMNTPTGNTITTAEHAIAMMCALTRSIPQATASMKDGKWEKSKFMGAELTDKNLGVVGCGNIGKIVASRAQGLKMNVLGFDPFLSEELAEELGITKVTLLELFQKSDYITVHTPLNEKTKHLINTEAFKEMKKGVYIINCARGGIVDEQALAQAIDQGIVAGAALDVFEEEPPAADHPLLKSDRVICTPHLGASTEEAQENVAIDVANQIVDFLVNGNVKNALNAASASGKELQRLGPYLNLGQKIGQFHGQLCEESPKEINVTYFGDIAGERTAPVTTAILQGILQPMLSDVAINNVNAPYLAKERGITVKETKNNSHSDYTSLISVNLVFKNGEQNISGTIFGRENPRLVQFNQVRPELNPEGKILIVSNNDKPGVVGRVGTALGEEGVNIANMQLCLNNKKQQATGFFSVSGQITQKTLDKITALDEVLSVQLVEL